MTIRAQYVVLFHHLRQIMRAANEQGIDVAPLKGAHLLTGVYPAGEDRGWMADVDFLVRPKDFEAVCELLHKLGFVRSVAEHRPRTVAQFYEACFHYDLGQGQSLLVEPHRYLIQPERHPVDYDALWRRSTASTFDGAPCRRLATEDHFLHGVIHLMTDRFITPGRKLRDLQLLVTRGRADLDTVVERARQWECARPTWLALGLLHQRAPDLGADRHAARLAPPRLVQRALAHLVLDAGEFRFPQLGMRQGQALLWSVLFDTPIQALRFSSSFIRLRLQDAWAHYLGR